MCSEPLTYFRQTEGRITPLSHTDINFLQYLTTQDIDLFATKIINEIKERHMSTPRLFLTVELNHSVFPMDVVIREESDQALLEQRAKDFLLQDQFRILPFRMVYKDGDIIRAFCWFNPA